MAATTPNNNATVSGTCIKNNRKDCQKDCQRDCSAGLSAAVDPQKITKYKLPEMPGRRRSRRCKPCEALSDLGGPCPEELPALGPDTDAGCSSRRKSHRSTWEAGRREWTGQRQQNQWKFSISLFFSKMLLLFYFRGKRVTWLRRMGTMTTESMNVFNFEIPFQTIFFFGGNK